MQLFHPGLRREQLGVGVGSRLPSSPGTQPPAGGAFAFYPRANRKTGAKPGAGIDPDPPLPPGMSSHPRVAGMLALCRRGHLVPAVQETGAVAFCAAGAGV